MSVRRLAALGALLLGLGAAALTALVVAGQFPGGLLTALALALSAAGAWYGIVRRGAMRILVLATALTCLVAAAVLAVSGSGFFGWILVAALAAAAGACAATALGSRPRLPCAVAPQHPVLFVNPRSGGGKATRFKLMAEAQRRGIEVVELRAGDDLESLARAAVASGADALAMAGGDGSQAVIAAIAAETHLPFACVPAGTRNHFALDLGVDRDDVVGALDAFVDGGERRVDLADVNGRVFVNNVSLGLYAEAVQREGYRETKIRTLLGTLAAWHRGEATGPELRWTGPGGHAHGGGGAILVSNNSYRLGHVVGSGTRPRIDGGMLGVTVAGAPRGREGGGILQRPWREWSAPTFEVAADGPVPTGIDGEAVVLEPPLLFSIRPGALRVRIASSHPGASPSASMPEHPGQMIGSLWRMASGRE